MQESDPKFWISVLKVAVPLCADESATRARRYLESFTSVQLPPALKLNVARACEVDDWTADAFTDLLSVDLTDEDAAWLELRTYHTIMTLKSEFQIHSLD